MHSIKRALCVLVTAVLMLQMVACQIEPKEEIVHYTDTAFVSEFMPDLEGVVGADYECVSYKPSSIESSYRGLIFITDERADLLNQNYEWVVVESPVFVGETIDFSVALGNVWYSCDQFNRDYVTLSTGCTVYFNGVDALYVSM